MSKPASTASMSAALGNALYLAHRRYQLAANAVVAGTGLQVRHLGPLGVLRAHGTCRQRDLLDLLAMDKSTLANVIDELVRRGLVARSPAPDDRRANLVSVTPKGRRLLDQIQPQLHQLEHTALAGLPAAHRRQLYQLLATVADNLANADT